MHIIVWTVPDCAKCKILIKTLSATSILEIAEVIIIDYNSSRRAGKTRIKAPGIATVHGEDEKLLGVLTAETDEKSVLKFLDTLVK